ncbi:MAG TPA: ATP-binding protein [Spirochaetales bacterium]|nr:ATP-binding protein [Spirochaetales bacterium]
MIKRCLETPLRKAAAHYPVVCLSGPRQSGKTTLVQSIWPDKRYVSLEDPDQLEFASSDPRGFLEQAGDAGMILDEAQRLPPLFNYLQGYADRSAKGAYILTGSNNFLLMEGISQSLAGRAAILHLLPFCAAELGAGSLGDDWESCAYCGFYPRVRADGLPPDMFSRDYLATYVERDVRLVRNIQDQSAFRAFLKLCAGRAGQALNVQSMAHDAGISVNTAKDWLGLLEAAFLVFLVRPWNESFNKRLVKSPKLYWLDTGLLCRLLDIRAPGDLAFHAARGAVFENLLMAERWKAGWHRGEEPAVWFWRDNNGVEVDLVDERDRIVRLWEAKAGKTIAHDMFAGLESVGTLAGIPADRRFLVYGGQEAQTRRSARVLPWSTALVMD